MDTPLKQNKATSNLLKIQRKYKEDGTPQKDAITILTKKQICDEVDRGTKYKDICKIFNLKYVSNVTRIYKEKDRWIDEFNKDASPFRKTTKTTKFSNIENGLKNFIANANNAGMPASLLAIQERGKELVAAAGVSLTMSNGFVHRFKKRNEIKLQKKYGEEASVDPLEVSSWKIKLIDIIKNVDPNDIFNGDELGLFWRLSPNQSYCVKDGVCKFGKQSKERVTVYLSASMTGEKLKPVVIGKSAEPRNYHLIKNLPMWYYSNKSAWMTGELWMQILNRLNKQIRNDQHDRNILLFIDNCPAHPDNGIKFSNITIRFLPKNTTSVFQPFDQGIIKCFKGYYKLRICRKLMNALNLPSNEIVKNTQIFKPTLIKFYDCCEMLTSA